MLGEPVEKTGIADGEVSPRCSKLFYTIIIISALSLIFFVIAYHKAWFFIDHPKCLLHFVFCSKVERNRSPASECADSHNSNYHDCKCFF